MIKTKKNKKRQDLIFITLMLIIPIAHFLLFWVYVNYRSIGIAFKDPLMDEFSMINFERFFSAWKRDFAEDGTLKVAVANTLISTLITVAVNIPLVVFTSFILFKKFFGHMFYRIVFYLPGIIGGVVLVTMTTYLLDATGPIVSLGKAIGVNWSFDVLQSGLLGNPDSARPTFFITSVSISGATVLLITGALNRIPQDLFDSGKLDGIGIFREFYYMALPLVWSTVGIMWIMAFAGGWGEYNRTLLLTGGAHKTTTFGFFMVSHTLSATTGNESFNYPAAVGLLLTFVVAPVTLLLRWLSNKLVEPVEF